MASSGDGQPQWIVKEGQPLAQHLIGTCLVVGERQKERLRVFAEAHGWLVWKEDEASEKWPIKTAQDLKIEDLQRENDAAFERIQKLSAALVSLGYDPTQLI